ncbi:transporter substrate-binding domain-containing protein [Pseudomonas fluorescens]|nr:transporter substrate-binding domain-containing protein [Pseudomonas fluorescens]
MKMKKLIAILGVVGAFSVASQLVQAEEVLKIGMDPMYEPFSFQTPDGNLTGFDYEISNALCDALKVKCDVQPIPYDGSISALQSGKIDALINTYAMTKERLDRFTMVGPYIRPTYRFMVDSHSSLDGKADSMKGKVVGIEKGSAPVVAYAKDKFGPTMKIEQYEQINDAILDLNSGRVDAVFGDENQLFYAYAKKQPDTYKMIGESISAAQMFGEGQGFMLRKEDDKWPARLKVALATIVQDGKYDQISKKYFGRNILTNQ